jgi:hypothetical protein
MQRKQPIASVLVLLLTGLNFAGTTTAGFASQAPFDSSVYSNNSDSLFAPKFDLPINGTVGAGTMPGYQLESGPTHTSNDPSDTSALPHLLHSPRAIPTNYQMLTGIAAPVSGSAIPSAASLGTPTSSVAIPSPITNKTNASTTETSSSASGSTKASSNQQHTDTTNLNGFTMKSISETGKPADTKFMSAGVEFWDSANLSKIIEQLVDHHFATSPEARKLDQQVAHFRSGTQRFITASKDQLNYTFEYRGLGPSEKAGQLILDNKTKIKDAASAEFERQCYVDRIHTQIVSAMMQIAMGMGITGDAKRSAEVTSAGYKSLETLVGTDQAQKTMHTLRSWLDNISVPESTFARTPWDTIERNAKLEQIIAGALQKDPVVGEIRKKLEKYAHPGKVKKYSTQAIETTLNLVSWAAPGIIIPVSTGVALNAYVFGTGGPEESKLRKELIYDKRVQSRLQVLDREATLAIDNYRFAQVSHNAPLLSLSEAVIADMASRPVASKVLIGQVAPANTKPITPMIIESKSKQQLKTPYIDQVQSGIAN